MDSQFNVAILGKTGVGKSSLINYLLGEDRCQKGTGAPQTRRGFHKETIELRGVQGTLFDSWGLEPDKSVEWQALLADELRTRGITMPVSEWFHTVIYCIQASGHRVEPMDAQIVRQFLDGRYRVVVVLTKADGGDAQELAAMTAALHQQVGRTVPVVPVCSEEKKLFGGRKTERAGREALIEEIHNHLWESIRLRLPDRCEAMALARVEQFYEGWKLEIETTTAEFNLHDMYNRLNAAAQQFDQRVQTGYLSEVISNEIARTFETYGHVFGGLNGTIAAEAGQAFEWHQGLEDFNEFWSNLQGIFSVIITGGLSLFWAKQENKKTLMAKLDKFCDRHRENIRGHVKELVAKTIEQQRRHAEARTPC